MPVTIDDVRLTDKEQQALNCLRDAEVNFAQLSISNPDDLVQFQDAVTRAKLLIAVRVAARVDPAAWA